MIICWAEDWGGLVLRLFQVGHCNFGLGLGLVVLCWYIHIFNILDRDVFSPRREKSAPQNLHTTCIDNGSNNGVLKCKFRLPELSNSGTNIKYVSWSCIDLDLIIFLKYNSWLFWLDTRFVSVSQTFAMFFTQWPDAKRVIDNWTPGCLIAIHCSQ